MTAQDTEVLALFEQEAEERLRALGGLLLQLETEGMSDELIARLFREAHTLKGAANVVGLSRLGAEAHALEDLFDHVRTGQIPVTPELVDQMLGAVDRLEELAGFRDDRSDDDQSGDDQTGDDQTGGVTPTEAPPSATVDHRTVPGAALAAPPPALAPQPPALDAPSPVVPASRSNGDESARSDDNRHETARVSVDRLDDIVRLAGESTAAHLRLAQLVRDELGIDPYVVPELRSMSRLLTDLQEAALRARMLPLAAANPALRRVVRDVGRRTGKEVDLEFRGEDTELDRAVHERLVDALVHIVRNALDHGIETIEQREAAGKPPRGSVIVHAMQLGSRVVVTITDDGRGVDVPAVRSRAEALGIDTAGLDDGAALDLLFHPGLTTAPVVTDVSGRGVGLDAVRESLAELRGRVDVESTPGAGTVFRISVPITLTVLRALVVRAGGHRYAVPMSNVLTVLGADVRLERVEGRPAVRVDRGVVGVTPLHAMLGEAGGGEGPVVVVTGVSRTHAFVVDEVEAERDVLLKNLPAPIPASDLMVGASAEPDGTVMLVLDAETLVDEATSRRAVSSTSSAPASAPVRPSRSQRILVVDDALTVRELQRMILERAGYTVTTAVDGRAALERIDEAAPDLVLTDVEMPELDGLGLVREIRGHGRWSNVPIVILTSRGEEHDRRAGLDAGADAYIVKSAFDEASLLGVVERLLGAAA